MPNLLKRMIFPFCGNLRHRVHALEREVRRTHDILDAMSDISLAHKATGARRVIQCAEVKLLSEITDLLTASGIQYSLCGGTLLGAVRHGGFIPWDDDVDMAVLREDYERVFALIRERFNAERGYRISRSTCIRVILSGTPCQVDVFPFEVHRIPCDDAEGMKRFSEARDRMIDRIQIDWERLKTDGNVIVNMNRCQLGELIAEFARQDEGECKVLATGCETANRHYPPLKYDWVFPLKKINFEGLEFFAPADPEVVVLNYFGDYMNFPKAISCHEDIKARLSVDAFIKMRNFAKGINS